LNNYIWHINSPLKYSIVRKFLFLLAFLCAYLPVIASDCSQGDADFCYTINQENCSVQFSPCNSGGLGTWHFDDGSVATDVQSALL